MPKPVDGHANAIHLINTTLQGAVVDVLCQLVPEVRALPRQRALEAILDDVALLEKCFTAFRQNQDRFRDLLVDGHKVPVKTAEDILRCGRSLDDVVAMVVRTAAKRYFRKRLDHAHRPLKRTKRAQHQRHTSLLDRLVHLFSAAPPPSKGLTRAQLLYQAIQEHLKHDWQVALVPEYANLTPRTVRLLGARLLDYRVAADIRRLGENPDTPPKPTPVAAPPPLISPPSVAGAKAATMLAKEPQSAPVRDDLDPPGLSEKTTKDERAKLDEVLTPSKRMLRPAAFGLVLLDPTVRAALPDPGATVRITDTLSGVGALATKMLVGELGLRADQLAVLLINAQSALGEEKFSEIFGLPGRADVIAKLIEQARAAGIDQHSPVRAVAALTRGVFTV